jgi:hypothetical protein
MLIFHDLDGSFGKWLAVEAIATDDDAGHLVRCMRTDPVLGDLDTQFASLAEFVAFLKFLEADPEAFAAACELWARYERWRRQ